MGEEDGGTPSSPSGDLVTEDDNPPQMAEDDSRWHEGHPSRKSSAPRERSLATNIPDTSTGGRNDRFSPVFVFIRQIRQVFGNLHNWHDNLTRPILQPRPMKEGSV